MISERIRRQISRLLDEAEQASSRLDWTTTLERAQAVLVMDPDDVDALAYLGIAERGLASGGQAIPQAPMSEGGPAGTLEADRFTVAPSRYRILRPLSEDSIKKVYLADDMLNGMHVAFAVIKTDRQTANGRIIRDAEAVVRLGDHRNIVSCYDVGLHGGQLYVVFPYLQGSDLEAAMKQAETPQLPFEQVIRVTEHICLALEQAHSQGIIHLSLSPRNVWLTDDGVAKVAGFGFPVSINGNGPNQAENLRQVTPYMAPEQATQGGADARSDLYSLGCTVYAMVTGRPPFVGDHALVILGQHLNNRPVPPSWYRPDVPADLERLILRLLEKDPQDRPSSAAEVRQAIALITLADDRPTEPPIPRSADNPLYRGTFVGRARELDQLQTAFDGAISGRGAVVMVSGEPGIGKSSLCDQFATYVSLKGGRSLLGGFQEGQTFSRPYKAVAEAILSYILQKAPEALRSELGLGAAEVAQVIPELKERAHVSSGAPMGYPDDQWRIMESVRAFLSNAGNIQPLLIVLEDLHWADRATLDLLLHIAQNVDGTRLLIVGTYCEAAASRQHPLAEALLELRRGGRFFEIQLPALAPDEVQRMVSDLTMPSVDPILADAVQLRTQGNPLFIQQVVRHLAEEGVITREGRAWRTTTDRPLSGIIPKRLGEVIARRVSGLDAECRRVLSTASVVGEEFRLEVLERVTNIPLDAMRVALEEAKAKALVEEGSRWGVPYFRFAHFLIQRTLHRALRTTRRLRLHGGVGDALEAVGPGDRELYAYQIAEHFSHSSDRSQRARALSYMEIAAERAIGRSAYADAADLLQKCVRFQEDVNQEDKQSRCELLLALGHALVAAGRPWQAVSAIAPKALGLAQATGNEKQVRGASEIAVQGIMRANGTWGLLDRGTASLLATWAEPLGVQGSDGLAGRVYTAIAQSAVAFSYGDIAEARQLAHEALAAAQQTDDVELPYWAAGWVFQAGLQYGFDELLSLAEEFTSRPKQGVSPIALVHVLWRSGMIYLEWGNRARAEELWKECEDIARRTRDPSLRLRPLMSSATLALLDGRLEESIAARQAIVGRAKERNILGFGEWLDWSYADWAWIWLGRASEALARRRRRPPYLLAHLGRQRAARAALRQTMSLGQRGISQLATAIILEDRGAAAGLTQSLGSADRLTLGLTCVARHLGAAAELLGQPDKARAYYHQALEVAGAIVFRPEVALTQLQLAELLLNHYPNERVEAFERLDVAIREFRHMHMTPSLERALQRRGVEESRLR